MTEYKRSRILSESPQHGPVLLGELDKAEAELAATDGVNMSLKDTLEQVKKERDLALAQLGEAREASKIVDDLMDSAVNVCAQWKEDDMDGAYFTNSMNARMLALEWKIEAAAKALSRTPANDSQESK